MEVRVSKLFDGGMDGGTKTMSAQEFSAKALSAKDLSTKDHASRDFRRQLEGYGLTTANILYRRPDHP